MRRRDFIVLAGAATLAPVPLRAQPAGRVYRLGAVIPSGRQTPPMIALFDELRLGGFIEGQNLEVIPGGFGVRNEQIPEIAAAMVKAAPHLIVCGGVFATRAVQQATRTIHVVALSEDMVADGFVTSLPRPGGNTTGVSMFSPELDGKRQEFLIEAVPRTRRIAILADSSTTTASHLQALQDAVRRQGVEPLLLAIARPEEIVPAIERAKASGAQGLNVLATPLFGAYPNRLTVVEHAMRVRLPGIHQWPEMAEEGGFAAYGPRFTGIYRQVARQMVRVLRGTAPSEIPVEQPTHFELVLNLKTAKAIGHEIPAGLVLRADKLIE